MNTAAPVRPGRGLDALILIAALLTVGIGVAWFLARDNAPAAPASGPVDALNSLALDAQGAATGDERSLNSLETSLKDLKEAAAATPDAPFVKDERYQRIVSNASAVLQARGSLADAGLAVREARDIVPKLLNEVGREKSVTLTPDAGSLTRGKASAWKTARVVGPASPSTLPANAPLKITLPGYGLTVVALDF